MSKKKDTYTQCTLIKGEYKHTAWIPSEFANMDQIVKIEILPNKWEDGYKVIEIFGTRTAEEVESHERDYLKQRQASDI